MTQSMDTLAGLEFPGGGAGKRPSSRLPWSCPDRGPLRPNPSRLSRKEPSAEGPGSVVLPGRLLSRK